MRLIAITLFMTGLAFSQALPDAPQPQPTCTYHDHPCSALVTKIVGQYPPQNDQDIKPGSECWLEDQGNGVMYQHCRPIRISQPQTAHFLTTRRWTAPRLHPGKLEWITFLGTHAAGWALLATANHQKEPWLSESPAFGAETGLDLLGFLFINPAAGNIGSIRAIVHYGGAQ